jgi:hypothetical protein
MRSDNSIDSSHSDRERRISDKEEGHDNCIFFCRIPGNTLEGKVLVGFLNVKPPSFLASTGYILRRCEKK